MTDSKKSCPIGCCMMKALSSGFLATVVMTVAMGLMGMDTMKSLGTLFLGGSANKVMIYFVGGLIHFGVGIFYGLIYAKVDGFMKVMHPVMRGALYGFLLTVVAYFGMPVLVSVGNAVRGDEQAIHNPCNPCVGQSTVYNPCHKKDAYNPCNPCMQKGTMNPCNPCNPCAKPGFDWEAMLMSLGNHLVYGIVLALMYCRGCQKD